MMSFTAAQLRDFLGGGEILGDPKRKVARVAPPQNAGDEELTFIFAKKWLNRLHEVNASVVVLPRLKSMEPPKSHTYLLVHNVGEAMIRLLSLFFHPPFSREMGISPLAYVSNKAILGEGATIYPFAFVDDEVAVGEKAIIMPHVFVGRGAQIGYGSVIMPSAVIYPGTEIGDNVVIHAGAVLGADGFGYVENEGRRIKIPQVGGLKIARDVEIGANTCIDRATMGCTSIDEGTKVDNLVQIGHNVKIGKHCAFAGQVGISGSVEVGDRVLMGGQAGIADHIRIGNDAIVTAKAGIMSDVEKAKVMTGAPALPHGTWRRAQALLIKLPNLARKLARLEKQLEELKGGEDRDQKDS